MLFLLEKTIKCPKFVNTVALVSEVCDGKKGICGIEEVVAWTERDKE